MFVTDGPEGPEGWYNRETGQWDKSEPSMPAFARDEQLILDALGRGVQFAVDLSRVTKVGVGKLYPALAALEERGAITSQWVEDPKLDRVRRRAYRLAD